MPQNGIMLEEKRARRIIMEEKVLWTIEGI